MRDTTHTSDTIRLVRYRDLVALGVVRNRTTLGRWMQRSDDPFPAPLVLTASDRQAQSVAWRLRDVSAWLDRREAAK